MKIILFSTLLCFSSSLFTTAIKASSSRLCNWGRNVQYSTLNIYYPTSTSEVVSIVKNAKGKVRALGTRFSANPIADSNDTLISILNLNEILSINESVPSVTVHPGVTYSMLSPYLEWKGFALQNIAVSDISISGGTQTGAHGSGKTLGSLPTQIRSLKIVLANGTVAKFDSSQEAFKGVALGLGVFGVVTEIELNLLPPFRIINYVFLNLSLPSLYEHFDDIQNKGYSVQLYSSFKNAANISQVWIKSLEHDDHVGSMQNLFGAQRAQKNVTPIEGGAATYLVDQGVAKPFWSLNPSKWGLTGYSGNVLSSEFYVPYKNAVSALKALYEIAPEIRQAVYLMLVRTIEADDLWMSPFYHNRAVAFDIIFESNSEMWPALSRIESVLERFNARFHWGKVFTMKPSYFHKFYPKLNEFRKLADDLDPEGKFRNDFILNNVLTN